jgi:hypothetical protein
VKVRAQVEQVPPALDESRQILRIVKIKSAGARGENQAQDEYVGQRIMMPDFMFPAHVTGKVDGLGDWLTAFTDLQTDNLVGTMLDMHVQAVLTDDLDRPRRRPFQLTQLGGSMDRFVGARDLEPEPIVFDMDGIHALQRRHQACAVNCGNLTN